MALRAADQPAQHRSRSPFLLIGGVGAGRIGAVAFDELLERGGQRLVHAAGLQGQPTGGVPGPGLVVVGPDRERH